MCIPRDIYYHFYSGEYRASLKSLQDVYDWVLTQEIAPVFTSQYIEMVHGYLGAKIFRNAPETYTVQNYGKCLTVRLHSKNKQPDLTRSVNVLGFVVEPQGLYISLAAGKKEATVVLSHTDAASAKKARQPYLRKASGWVTHFEVKENIIQMDYQGYGKGSIELSGLKPGKTYKLSGPARNGSPERLKSNEKGMLLIKGVQTGPIEISW